MVDTVGSARFLCKSARFHMGTKRGTVTIYIGKHVDVLGLSRQYHIKIRCTSELFSQESTAILLQAFPLMGRRVLRRS